MNKEKRKTERRSSARLNYLTPLTYKICKKQTIFKLLQGYTSNISEAGLLCNIKDRVKKNDILWLSFDRNALSICEELDRRSLIYQNGVIGKVVRIEPKPNKTFDVGIHFIIREEKNLSHIYPEIYFLKDGRDIPAEEPEENEEEAAIDEPEESDLAVEEKDDLAVREDNEEN